MISYKENIMFKEAQKATFRPNFVIQILIFILVMFIAEIIAGVVTAIPMLVWMFCNSEIAGAIMAGNIGIVEDLISDMPSWLVVVQLFVTAAETLVAVIYCRYIEKRSLRSMGFTKQNLFMSYAKGYVLGAAMISAACGICVLTGNMRLAVSGTVNMALLIAFFAGYIVQGMAEEVLVRGYFMVSLANSLKMKNAAAVSALVSAVFFTAMHMQNPGMTLLPFVNIMLAGIFFAVYILRADNIWGACAAHSSWNFFQGHIIGSNVSGISTSVSVLVPEINGSSIITGGAFGLEGGLAVSAVMTAAILCMLFIPRKTV